MTASSTHPDSGQPAVESRAHEVADQLSHHHLKHARDMIDDTLKGMSAEQRRQFFSALAAEAEHAHGHRLPGLKISGSEGEHDLKVGEQWLTRDRHGHRHFYHPLAYDEKKEETKTEKTDEKGRKVTTYENNDHSGKTTITDDGKGHKTVEKDHGDGTKDVTEFDQGKMVSQSHEDTSKGTKDTTRYDGNGNELGYEHSEKDASGKTITTQFDKASGHTTTITDDVHGVTTSEVRDKDNKLLERDTVAVSGGVTTRTQSDVSTGLTRIWTDDGKGQRTYSESKIIDGKPTITYSETVDPQGHVTEEKPLEGSKREYTDPNRKWNPQG